MESPPFRREPVEIVGIVHPFGAGGGRVGMDTLWTLRFSLVAWRKAGGTIDERELFVQQPDLSDAELRARMESINPYDILRLLFCFDEAKETGERLQGTMLELQGKEYADDELNARAEQLRRPVALDHPFFGTINLNRALNCFEVDFPWKSRTIRLYLFRNNDTDDRDLFGTAQSLWKQQKEWNKRIQDFAVEKLLEGKNDVWLGAEEKEFTPRQFKRKMRLESIAIYPAGGFEFTYDDGDLFWGHVIQVSGTISEGPKHAGIAG